VDTQRFRESTSWSFHRFYHVARLNVDVMIFKSFGGHEEGSFQRKAEETEVKNGAGLCVELLQGAHTNRRRKLEVSPHC
jgi:hypothetical protein